MRRMLGMLILAATTASLVGCSKELMAGGERGEVVTTMNDGPSSSAARSDGSSSRRVLRSVLPAGTGPQGTVQANLQVALVDDAGRADVVAPSSAASVRIGASDGPEIGRDSVYVGLYTIARITFSSVSADITGGLPIVGQVTVPLTTPVTIDVPVALTVEPHSSHRVIIDLNASTWLAAVDPLTLTVPASAFRSALEVRTE